ncbi:hypothetical protein [Agrobacterium rosae]|uniref:hypothetical protein n=1 Tax=Agrobacterium rosae TaxID=1972867 RepID=UPI00203376BE|nr:hypothetical protein [Agrobacterium rosae]MCM2433199.1 hypothetical protein [Agrobacterium rosae]
MIKWKNANWLFVASSFTATYLVFIVVWIGPHEIIAFSETDELNAIGDFLAGIFSPLAFIWLVAAVLTQRQELTDTRDQFAKNQKVVDAQLETINEQSALLQQQHTLAEETARKTYRLSLFEQRFAIYNELIEFGKIAAEWNPLRRHELNGLKQISTKSGFIFNSEVEDKIDDIFDSFRQYVENYEEWKSTWYLDKDFNELHEPYGEQADEIKATLSSQRRAILEALDAHSVREIMWSSLSVSDT